MILQWIARILAVLYILFIGMFSLDVFSEGIGAWRVLVGFLIHNIPAFILIAVLGTAWKYPRIGGIGFLLCGVAMVFFVRRVDLWGALIFSSPLGVIGALFLGSGKPERS